MIAKVTRGQAPSGALRYLFGPGKEAEHTDPHVVAASGPLRAEAGSRPDKAGLEELAAAMDLPSTLFGTEVAAGPAWHLALSTKGGVDRDLTDDEWAEVARETVRRLGFDAGDGQAPCRWVAVRHGRSEAGNDHVHIVVNLVREDGKVARTSNDFRRLSRLCADMEARYGLSAVEGRANKAAMPGLSRAEAEKAKRTKRAETEREELARAVRAAATVATSEAEFVRLLRGAGLAARPRYDRAGAHRVVGYAVAEAPSDGGVAVFFGGGKLARDLSLPALWARWQDGEGERQEAVAEWGAGAPTQGGHDAARAGRHPTYRWDEARQRWGEKKERSGQEERSGGKDSSAKEAPKSPGDGARLAARQLQGPAGRQGPAGWQEAAEGLAQVVRSLSAVPAGDVATWRAAASDAAGALAVLSARTERSPGPLAKASGLLARSAQGPRQGPGRDRQPPRGTLRSVAAIMAQADLDEGSPAAWGLLLSELLRVAQALHDAHLARSEAEQASRLAGEARKALGQARARPGPLEALRVGLPGLAELAGEKVPGEQFAGENVAGEEFAEEKAAGTEAEASRRRRRRAGKALIGPEKLALTTRRPAPKPSRELVR